MDDFYTYYQLDTDGNGWLINYYDSENGYIDTVDGCSFTSLEKTLELCHTYDIVFEQRHLNILHFIGYFLDIKTTQDLHNSYK